MKWTTISRPFASISSVVKQISQDNSGRGSHLKVRRIIIVSVVSFTYFAPAYISVFLTSENVTAMLAMLAMYLSRFLVSSCDESILLISVSLSQSENQRFKGFIGVRMRNDDY